MSDIDDPFDDEPESDEGSTICPDCGEDLPWHNCRGSADAD